MMDISDKLAKENSILQVDDGFISSVGDRLICKFHQHARGEQQAHQNHGHASKSPGERESQRPLPNNLRTEVQHQGVQQTAAAFPLDLGTISAREDRIPDPLGEIESIWSSIARLHDMIFLEIGTFA